MLNAVQTRSGWNKSIKDNQYLGGAATRTDSAVQADRIESKTSLQPTEGQFSEERKSVSEDVLEGKTRSNPNLDIYSPSTNLLSKTKVYNREMVPQIVFSENNNFRLDKKGEKTLQKQLSKMKNEGDPISNRPFLDIEQFLIPQESNFSSTLRAGKPKPPYKMTKI